MVDDTADDAVDTPRIGKAAHGANLAPHSPECPSYDICLFAPLSCDFGGIGEAEQLV